MSILRHSFRALSRSKGKSLMVSAVSLVLVLFFTMYARAISEHEQTLAEMHESIEVSGQITNYNGTATDDLDIREEVIRELEASDFIGEKYYTRNLSLLLEPLAELEPGELEYKLMNAGRLVGANTIEAIPELISVGNRPQYLEGYNENIFASSEKVCIFSQDIMQSLNLHLGDMFEFTVAENARVRSANHPRGKITLKIVGVYSGSARMKAYCSWDVMTALYQELGLFPTWDSASFGLENTQRLDEFKALLNKLNFVSPYEAELDAVTGGGRLGFIINDRILSNVTKSVKGYIDFMTALYPVIYLLSGGIGFVISYLLIRLRKPEFAIMRSLGTSQGRSFLSFFWEQVFLCLLGASMGVLMTLAITKSVTALQAIGVVGYLVFYLAGAAIAIATMNRMNVIKILTAKE